MTRRAVIPAVCALYFLYYLRSGPAEPMFTPDSAGYLGFAPVQRLGYPFFLALFPPKAAMYVQPMLFAAALAWLGLEIERATSSVLAGAATVAAAVATPQQLLFHATIVSESLFMTGLVLVLATAARFARRPSWRLAAIASTVAGVTAIVRPAGAALLAVLIVMVAMQWRRLAAARWLAVAAAAAPMLAILAGERIAARAIHGNELTSLAGRHLYAKAGLIDAAPAVASRVPLQARLEARLNADYAPIREFLARAPADLRVVLSVYYEACLQGPCVPEEGVNLTWGGAALNDVLLRVALDRLARAPIAFVKLLIVNYRSLWSADKLRHPDTAAALNAFIASHRPLPFEQEAFALTPATTLEFHASASMRVVQPVVMLAGWLTAAIAGFGLVCAARGSAPSPVAAIAATGGLAAHAILGFSVVFAAGLARFTISVWSAVAVAIVAGGAALISCGIRGSHRSPG